MKGTVLLLVVAVHISAEDANDSYTGDDVRDLLKELFVTKEYNKEVRPIRNNSYQHVEVGVSFVLHSVIDFNEQQESLRTAGYLMLNWQDEYLMWEPDDYNGVPEILVPQDKIWKPDISLRNSYVTFTGLGSAYLNAKIASDGYVTWEPFQVLSSTCSVDISNFPFDTQTCEMKFIAWSYSNSEVNLQAHKAYTQEYSSNSAWDLVNFTFREVTNYESAVNFVIKLKRKPTFYVINVAIPVLLLTILNIFTFVLPISSGERNGFAITVFLSIAVFLTIVTAEFPQNSDVVSLFSVYLSLMTGLSTAIVMTSTLQLRLLERDATKQPVGCFFRALYKAGQIPFRITPPCKKTKDTAVQPLKDPADNVTKTDPDECVNKDNEDLTWAEVINSMDFLLFWFTLIITFVITAAIANKATNG